MGPKRRTGDHDVTPEIEEIMDTIYYLQCRVMILDTIINNSNSIITIHSLGQRSNAF
jgi:hypothetical protein